MILKITALLAAAALALTSFIATGSPPVQATLAVGNSTSAIASDPSAGVMLVTNQDDGTVSVININTLTVAATVPVGPNPRRMVIDAATHRAYITNAVNPGTLTVADTQAGVVATIPVGNTPKSLDANFFIGEVYVANNAGASVSVISTTTNTVIATIPVGNSPASPSSNAIIKKLYVVNQGDNTVSSIDEVTHTVLKTIPVGKGPISPAIDAQHAKVYVNNLSDKTVSVIDSTTDTVIKVIPTGQGVSGNGMANFVTVSAVYHRAYLPNGMDGTLTIIDTDTDSVTNTVAVGAGPIDCIVDANGGNIYVVNQGSNSVSILSAATESVIDTLPVGSAPWRILDALGHIFVLNTNGANPDSVTIAAEENTLADTQIATEFYEADFNHYFYTDAEIETRLLVDGIFGDAWHRTFQFFRVWTAPGPGRLPVCRLFSASFGTLSSHFYTLIPSECAARAADGWVLEDPAFFYLMPTDVNGNCPADTAALFRVYNNGMGGAPNHRLTADIATRDQMVALGWIAEGNGPLIIFACTPTLLNG